jgi:hypothetical protein
MENAFNFENLHVWQKSKSLVLGYLAANFEQIKSRKLLILDHEKVKV